MLNGKTPGGVSLVIWDEEGQSQTFEISVDIDILGLRQEIHDAFPKEPIQIDAAKDVVILSGRASSQEVADKVLEVVKGVTGKATSLIQVPPVQNGEVLLQVKFAEVNRSALSQLGINILSLPGAKTIGSITTQQFSAPIIQGQVGSIGGGASSATTGGSSAAFGLGNLLNIFLYNPQLNLAATIQALQSDNLLQILAEPNVLTESGKEGSFLAGGEFPFPVIQSSGGGTFPAITIQFKEFGIRLNFTPTITPDGLIHLKVKPEVSSLDFSNALTISGFTIPALSTRRVESEMDLSDGQSFAIAGLIDNQVTQQMTKMPGIGNIPILGNLFKSRQLQKSDDELLIVVTPRVVHPLEPANVRLVQFSRSLSCRRHTRRKSPARSNDRGFGIDVLTEFNRIGRQGSSAYANGRNRQRRQSQFGSIACCAPAIRNGEFGEGVGNPHRSASRGERADS